MKKNSIRNNKGITLMAEVITVILLIIIISIISYSSMNSLKVKKLNNMYSDITAIQEKAANYYMKYGKAPVIITEKVNDEDVLASIADERNPNDDPNGYYKIDISVLPNISLNNKEDDGYYFMNIETLTTYYSKGVKVNNLKNNSTNNSVSKTYHTVPQEYDDLSKLLINKDDGRIELSAIKEIIKYGTDIKTFEVTNSHGGELTVEVNNNDLVASKINGTTIELSNLGNINAGTDINVTVKCASTPKFNEATATYTLTIIKADGSGIVTMADWIYGETPSEPQLQSDTNSIQNVLCEYKEENAEDSTYTTTRPSNAGAYTVKATFAATTNYEAKTVTTNFKISRASLTQPNVSIDLEGKVTWGNVIGASGYEISFDNSTWELATSGSKSISTLSKGNKTAYIRAVTTNANYNTPSPTGSKSVTVYSLTLEKGTGINTVTGTGNYVKDKKVTITATPNDWCTWNNWTKASGNAPASTTSQTTTVTITQDTKLTANANVITKTISFYNWGETYSGTWWLYNDSSFTVKGTILTVKSPNKTKFKAQRVDSNGNHWKIIKKLTSNSNENIAVGKYIITTGAWKIDD